VQHPRRPWYSLKPQGQLIHNSRSPLVASLTNCMPGGPTLPWMTRRCGRLVIHSPRHDRWNVSDLFADLERFEGLDVKEVSKVVGEASRLAG
jgi:hypothetical protein